MLMVAHNPFESVIAFLYIFACFNIIVANTELSADQLDYDEWKNNYLSWLTDKQKNELEDLFEAGASKDSLFLKAFEFFDFEKPNIDTQSEPIDRLSEACFSFMREHSEFNSKEFNDAVLNMFESPADEDAQNQLITKANQLYAEMKDIDRKPFAHKFLPYCVKVFVLDALSQNKINGLPKPKIYIHHVNEFFENYDKFFTLYMGWLTEAQKSELNSLKAGGSAMVDEIFSVVMQIYSKTEGNTLIKASHDLGTACMAFVTYLAESSEFSHVDEFERIQNSASDIRTVAEENMYAEKISHQITAEINQLIANINDTSKKALASKYLGACATIFLFNVRKIRTYRTKWNQDQYILKEADIKKWTELYLNWLSNEQKDELITLKEEGATVDELISSIEDTYFALKGIVLNIAIESLYKGCSELMTYLVDEENLANFLLCLEYLMDDTSSNSEESISSFTSRSSAQFIGFEENLAKCADEHLLSVKKDSYKQNLVEKFVVPCSGVFVAALMEKEVQERKKHDEM